MLPVQGHRKFLYVKCEASEHFSHRWLIEMKTHNFHVLHGGEHSLDIRGLLHKHLLDNGAEILLCCAHNGFTCLVHQLLADAIKAAFQKALQVNLWS